MPGAHRGSAPNDYNRPPQNEADGCSAHHRGVQLCGGGDCGGGGDAERVPRSAMN